MVGGDDARHRGSGHGGERVRRPPVQGARLDRQQRAEDRLVGEPVPEPVAGLPHRQHGGVDRLADGGGVRGVAPGPRGEVDRSAQDGVVDPLAEHGGLAHHRERGRRQRAEPVAEQVVHEGVVGACDQFGDEVRVAARAGRERGDLPRCRGGPPEFPVQRLDQVAAVVGRQAREHEATGAVGAGEVEPGLPHVGAQRAAVVAEGDDQRQ